MENAGPENSGPFEALTVSDAELRALFGAMTDVVLVLDSEGRYRKVAPTNPTFLQRSAGELLGKSVHEIFDKKDADFFVAHIAQALGENRMHRVEYRLAIGGAEVWFEASVSPISADAVLWVARDITQRKQSEDERALLRRRVEGERRRLKRILASIPGVVWEAWSQAEPGTERTDFVSDSIATMLGYRAEEWLSAPGFWISIIHPDDRDAVQRAVAAAVASTPSSLKFRWIAKDGRAVWVESHFGVFRDGPSEPVCFRGITIDITEQKLLEDQLLHSRKMEAIGRLAGGVAHDFNNLLTVINGYTDLLAGSYAAGESPGRELRLIRRAGGQAALLTQRLLAFSGRQMLRPEVMNLDGAIADIQPILRRLLPEDIDMAVHLNAAGASVMVDPAQLEQVILNLVVNARDAMLLGGHLTIETGIVELDQAYAHRHSEVKPGRYVLLAVAVTGTGMTAATAARIFDPFFTTKKGQGGTGLGLAMVHGVVRQSGGHVWVYSEPGSGAIFKLYFPWTAEPAQTAPRQAESRNPLPSGDESILLVEDDESVRSYVADALSALGYTIIAAGNAHEALTKARSSGGGIALLLTDVVMPGISGRALAEQLLLEWPRVKVLYISGYTDYTTARHGILEPGIAFLGKPFSADALARKVRETLDAE